MRKFILILAIFCFCPSAWGATLNMAIKPMTEQYILGNIVKGMIEADTDLKVNLSPGIGGGTSNIMPALQKGDFDFYPEYTGTGWNMVLKKNSVYSEGMFDELQKGYHDLGLSWLGMTGFNNTFGIGVRKQIADKFGLKNISDLAPHAGGLVFGGEYDFFERADGYKALADAYGLKFKDTRDMDIGLKYAALGQGQIDVMNIFTTDGQLAAADIAVLKDDKGLYPAYACGFVIRDDILAKYPQLRDEFAKLAGLISDREMAAMNSKVESGDMEPEEVAAAFLKAKGLLK